VDPDRSVHEQVELDGDGGAKHGRGHQAVGLDVGLVPQLALTLVELAPPEARSVLAEGEQDEQGRHCEQGDHRGSRTSGSFRNGVLRNETPGLC
jgi:hypothetical protein